MPGAVVSDRVPVEDELLKHIIGNEALGYDQSCSAVHPGIRQVQVEQTYSAVRSTQR